MVYIPEEHIWMQILWKDVCENYILKIDGLVQERCNSIAKALELHLSCTNPLKWPILFQEVNDLKHVTALSVMLRWY